MTDLRYFSIAQQQAYLSPLNFQLGACLVSNGKVLSASYNQDRSIARLPISVMQTSHQFKLPPNFLSDKGSFVCPSLHAEVATLLKANNLWQRLGTKKRAQSNKQCLLRAL